jgi:hypothetical protein
MGGVGRFRLPRKPGRRRGGFRRFQRDVPLGDDTVRDRAQREIAEIDLPTCARDVERREDSSIQEAP